MADTKISELTEIPDVAAGDLLLLTDDPSGTPTSKNITVINALSSSVDTVPYARLTNTNDVGYVYNQYHQIIFNTSLADTDGMIDLASGTTTVLTCKTAGKYLITGQYSMEYYINGIRATFIKKNGSDYLIKQNKSYKDILTRCAVAVVANLDVDDYIELEIYQNAFLQTLDVYGSTTTGADYSPVLSMIWLGA